MHALATAIYVIYLQNIWTWYSHTFVCLYVLFDLLFGECWELLLFDQSPARREREAFQKAVGAFIDQI